MALPESLDIELAEPVARAGPLPDSNYFQFENIQGRMSLLLLSDTRGRRPRTVG